MTIGTKNKNRITGQLDLGTAAASNLDIRDEPIARGDALRMGQEKKGRPFADDGRLPIKLHRFHGSPGLLAKKPSPAITEYVAIFVDTTKQDSIHPALGQPEPCTEKRGRDRHLKLAHGERGAVRLQ
jgi:hypothetical protein